MPFKEIKAKALIEEQREKDTEFKLSPYISIGKSESFCYTPFACAGLNKKRGSNNIAMFKQINII